MIADIHQPLSSLSMHLGQLPNHHNHLKEEEMISDYQYRQELDLSIEEVFLT
jgi:hypothetical protein